MSGQVNQPGAQMQLIASLTMAAANTAPAASGGKPVADGGVKFVDNQPSEVTHENTAPPHADG